jgi:hypothetical protein
MTKYIFAALAFAAALTGIVGDTHDSARPGAAGITTLGWWALIFATLSFVVILLETHRDHAKINWQAQQSAKVRRVANRQIVEAIKYLLMPFHVLLTEMWTKKSTSEIDLDKLDGTPTYVVDLLFSATVRAEFDHVDLRATPNVYPPIVWWEYFAKHASEARELLNQAAAKYSGYLDPDTLAAIEEVRADEVVYLRLPGLGVLESTNKHISPFPLTFAFGPHMGLANLNAMLEKLRALLDRCSIREDTA